MQQQKQMNLTNEIEEINLLGIIQIIWIKKYFIIIFCSFLITLSLIYLHNQSVTYKSQSSFIKSDDLSVTTMNLKGNGYANEDERIKPEIFQAQILSDFLFILSSLDFQKKVLIENGYLEILNPEKIQINNLDNYIYKQLNSLRIYQNKDRILKTENPYIISIQGTNYEFISSYLNKLIAAADLEAKENLRRNTQEEINRLLIQLSKKRQKMINNSQNQIAVSIEELKKQRESLISIAKQSRMNEIIILEEDQARLIREINDEIERVKIKAKDYQLNLITELENSAKLARSLGVIENNFQIVSKGESNSRLFINVENNVKNLPDWNLPDWFLYGEKALLATVGRLKNRTYNISFDNQLLDLKTELLLAQKDNTLIMLQNRKDDAPFVPEIVRIDYEIKRLQEGRNTLPFNSAIVDLDYEINQLKAFNLDWNGASALQLSQIANTSILPLKPNKNIFVALTALISFITSIFLILFMNFIKPIRESLP